MIASTLPIVQKVTNLFSRKNRFLTLASICVALSGSNSAIAGPCPGYNTCPRIDSIGGSLGSSIDWELAANPTAMLFTVQNDEKVMGLPLPALSSKSQLGAPIILSKTAYIDSHAGSSVATDGVNFLVAWSDIRNGTADIYGVLLGATGATLKGPFPIASGVGYQTAPKVAFGRFGQGYDFYEVVWADTRSGTSSDIYGARVGIDGSVLDAKGVALVTGSTEQNYPSVAFSGSNFLIAYEDSDLKSGDTNIGGVLVNSKGQKAASPFLISQAANLQMMPTVAASSSQFLVAYEDYSSGVAAITGTTVSTSGALTGTMKLSGKESTPGFPAVAAIAADYMSVWNADTTNIYGARLQGGGKPVATGVLAGSALSTQGPALTTDGVYYIMTWAVPENGAVSFYIEWIK